MWKQHYSEWVYASAATSVAWDNFDRVVETKTGKDMLHETVGIAYQALNNSQHNILEDNRERQVSNKNTKLKKRKRSYSTLDVIITPYRKKLKFVEHCMLELNDSRHLKYEKICEWISSPQKYDSLWMADFMFNYNNTSPMWVGWNAKYSEQKQDYSKSMVPPTNQLVSEGRNNKEMIIKDTIRNSKRKYFRDIQSGNCKVTDANSSRKKANIR